MLASVFPTNVYAKKLIIVNQAKHRKRGPWLPAAAVAAPRLPYRERAKTAEQGYSKSHRVSETKTQEIPKASFSGTYLDVSTTNGDDGSGGRIPPTLYTAEDGGNNFFEQNPLIDALVKGGVALSELPFDLQVAMKMGLLTVKDIHQWVAISATPILGSLCRMMPAVRDRLMGNPRFLIQMGAELAVGLSAKAVAEMKARGDRCFKDELPFFLSDIALEIIADIALVSLLSPKRSFKPLPTNAIGKAMARLPGHALQKGSYTLSQRALTILYRGAQFFAVGFMTSVIGHSITKWAVERKAGPKDDVHLAPVLDNSLGFGYYMILSSNLRYQTVNCIEQRVLDVVIQNKALSLLSTIGLRFSNCYLGSEQWLQFAKALGLQ